MKIRLNLPTLGETFSHDAPLYKIIRLALPAFILISSLTVFAGVRSHINDYLSQYSFWITVPGYTFAYLLFSLSPDILNTVLVAYLVRSLLKQKFQLTDIILNAFALVLIVFLTKYSYNMSQFSAMSVSNEIGQEIEVIDLSKINSEYATEKREIQSNFNNNKIHIEEQYNERLTLLEKQFQNQLIPLREKIKNFEKNRAPKNTQWTNKKIKTLKNQMSTLEKSKLEKTDNFLKEKQDKIAQIEAERTSDLKVVNENRKNDRNNQQSLKEKTNAEKAQANAFLKKEFEKIAGVAIFIVLILASLKEIIHFRNEINPSPILGELDFQFNWLQEIFLYPFIWIQRHSLNKIRRKYNALPKLESPLHLPEIIQYNATQKIILLSPETDTSDEENSFFFRKAIRANTDKNFRKPFIADENQTKTDQISTTPTQMKSPKSTYETPEKRLAKQRLKQYKKDLGKHQQKARVQLRQKGKILPRTQKAIENNKSWVEHWEDILNGGEGTRG
jgi:hypothetical protein